MKNIGNTSSGNLLLEVTPAEVQAVERVPATKAGANCSGPVAAAMTLTELADYVAPRLVKSRPNRKEKAANFIEAMFQFSGKIRPEQLARLFEELRRRQVMQEKAGVISYPLAHTPTRSSISH